jgi:hypothetical protein
MNMTQIKETLAPQAKSCFLKMRKILVRLTRLLNHVAPFGEDSHGSIQAMADEANTGDKQATSKCLELRKVDSGA